MLKDKDIKKEMDCTHLVPPRESYSIEEYERIVKEAAEILHEVDLHTYQMDIDIAPYAGNAFLNDDEGQMEFYKGFHRALVMMREYLDEKRSPLLLKQYDAEQNQQTYSEYVKKQMATLKDYDCDLHADVVNGLVREGWKVDGGAPLFVLLSKKDSAIKVFRHAESPQVINICFSAEPEGEKKKPARVKFTEDEVKKYLDKCISYWREQENGLVYVDTLQSVRMSLFGELKQDERKENPS